MELFQVILISLCSYIAAECVPILMGDFGGYYVMSKPLASGLIIGLILGDVATGVTVGAAVQTVYLATMSVGGAIQTDITIVAYPAVALGVVAGGNPEIAIALATTLGIIGILIWNMMEFCNVFWGNLAAKEADKGNYKGILLYHVGGSQLTTFLLRFGFSFLILYFGADYVVQFANEAPEWIIHGLEVIGGVLPAVGITMITSLLIKDASYWVYFLIGFVLITYLGLSMVAVAIIAVIIAVIGFKIMGQKKTSNDADDNDMEVEF